MLFGTASNVANHSILDASRNGFESLILEKMQLQMRLMKEKKINKKRAKLNCMDYRIKTPIECVWLMKKLKK